MRQTIRYGSPMGPILVEADEIGLVHVDFETAAGGRNSEVNPVEETEGKTREHLKNAIHWLDLYFEGKDPGFIPPLHLMGSDFQKTVWQQLLRIPFGESRTYGDIAKAIALEQGREKMSAQAVGGAVGSNPVCIIVPCHRVMGAGGGLTGYGGGLDHKRELLILEKIPFKERTAKSWVKELEEPVDDPGMPLLFVLDSKDYDPKASPSFRPSCRTILIKEGKIAMVHSRLYDYYKFPGGGMEIGESKEEAVLRETLEEAGIRLRKDSVKPFGFVHRIEKGGHDPLFVQNNYYFTAEIEEETGKQNLDPYESEEGFTPVWIDPGKAMEANRKPEHGPKDPVMIEREARVLQLLIAEGYFGCRSCE